MKIKNIKNLAQYENQYIATSENTVIAAGKTITQVEKELEKQKIKDAIIGFIPPMDKAISPVCQ